MNDITIEEAVKILEDMTFYEQVENHDVDGPRWILRTNNRLKQARDVVLKELNSKNETINALKTTLEERTDERDKKEKIIELIKNRIFVFREEHEQILKIQEKHINKSYDDCTIEYFENKANEETI